MEIQKELGAAEKCPVSEEELAQINRFARAELTAEQVYCFAVRLCDNEVDRDFERFDEETLSALGDLFVGKTGIFDHQWSAEGQTARIYRTELVHEKGRRTAAGDTYCWLKGWAYLLRCEKNADLIAEIEGGIKKEVSVGCSVKRSICSVCGAESGSCEHIRGREYGGKLCYAELRGAADAYEWSFVAVPAQRDAGVVKKFTGRDHGEQQLRTLQYEAQLGRNYLSALRREVLRLAMLADEALDGEIVKEMLSKLEEPMLLELKRGYGVQAAKRFPLKPQLSLSEERREVERGTQTEFLV